MDVEFHLDDGFVGAHRVVLVTASRIFLECFKNNQDRYKFELDKYCTKTVESAINFIYTSKLDNECCTVELIEFAHEFKIKSLIAHLDEISSRFITSKNALDFYIAAEKIGLVNLMDHCFQLMYKNKIDLKEIISTGGYDSNINDKEIIKLLLKFL